MSRPLLFQNWSITRSTSSRLRLAFRVCTGLGFVLKILGMRLGRFGSVMGRMMVMPVRDVRMVGGLMTVALFMVASSLTMMMGCPLIMLGGLRMMFVFRH